VEQIFGVFQADVLSASYVMMHSDRGDDVTLVPNADADVDAECGVHHQSQASTGIAPAAPLSLSQVLWFVEPLLISFV